MTSQREKPADIPDLTSDHQVPDIGETSFKKKILGIAGVIFLLGVGENVALAKRKPHFAPQKGRGTVTTTKDDKLPELNALIEKAFDVVASNNYQAAANIFDKILATPQMHFFDAAIYGLAAESYAFTKQERKVTKTCSRGVNEAKSQDKNPVYRERFIMMLEACYQNLPPGNADSQLKYLMMKYALQTGSNDKDTILRNIALNPDDAKISLEFLGKAERYEQEADLLTFYFQANPALIDHKDQAGGCDFALLAWALNVQGGKSAENYLKDRRSEKRWAERFGKIIPAVPFVWGAKAIYDEKVKQEEKEREEAERKRREEEEKERRRKAQHDAENSRRRAQGLPSLEEESARERERQEVQRERIREDCRERCVIAYHSCLGGADPKCCGGSGCLFGYCPNVCNTGLASCKAKCL